MHAFIPLILFSVALNAFAQLALKKGMVSLGALAFSVDFITRALANPYLWLGMGFYAVSILSWLVVLSKVSVSVAYPFLSVGFIISAVVAYFAFKEPLTAWKVLGILLICAGLFFISKDGR